MAQYSLEAEQLLIGAILGRPDAWPALRGRLDPDWLFEPIHRRILGTIQALTNGTGRVSVPHVVSALEAAHDRDEHGDIDIVDYVQRIADYADPMLDLEKTLDLVRDLALRREIVQRASELARDAADTSPGHDPATMLRELRTWADRAATSASPTCDLPSLDWTLVANREPPAERWLIDRWLPVGTAGVMAGPGSAGKSYLELIRMICLASGTPWLGYQTEPSPCLGYFSEDNAERLWRRVRAICIALELDPARLAGRLEIVSTVGHRRVLVESERFAQSVATTDWLEQVHDRARRLQARYIVFDHAGRLTAINRNDPGQVFDMFAHLDGLATSIDGCVSLLAHPSKGDLRAAKGPRVGGTVAMIDAPRWVHDLRQVRPEDDEPYRVLTSEKANYAERFAIKLTTSPRGIVEFAGEIDPDQLEGAAKGAAKLNPRHRPSRAEETLNTLSELFAEHRRAIHIDELTTEAIKRGIIVETGGEHREWRNRRGTIRRHLERFSHQVDARDDDTFAIKP